VNTATVAMTLAIVSALTVFVNIAIVMRLLNIGALEIARALRTPLLAGVVMVLAILPVNLMDALSLYAHLAIVTATGVFGYAGAVYAFDRNVFRELRRLLGGTPVPEDATP
jgi:hypothetical protein